MTLQHQETQEPPTSEVVRLAQQMYERDRAEKERQSSLAAAAEEMGIPSEYLTKAAAQLKARQVPVMQRSLAQRSPVAVMVALVMGLMVAVILGYLLTFAGPRAPEPMPSPPVMVQPSPPPVMRMPDPSGATPTTPLPAPKTGGPRPVPASAGY